MSMLKMFRKKAIQKKAEQPHIEKAAFFLAKGIIATQTRIATWLSRQEQKLTVTQKKWGLALFCLTMSMVAASFLYRGLTGRENAAPSWLEHHAITLPESTQLPDSLNHTLLKEIEKMKKAGQYKQDSIQH